jgi:hypothetical protein
LIVGYWWIRFGARPLTDANTCPSIWLCEIGPTWTLAEGAGRLIPDPDQEMDGSGFEFTNRLRW